MVFDSNFCGVYVYILLRMKAGYNHITVPMNIVNFDRILIDGFHISISSFSKNHIVITWGAKTNAKLFVNYLLSYAATLTTATLKKDKIDVENFLREGFYVNTCPNPDYVTVSWSHVVPNGHTKASHLLTYF